MRRGEHTKPDCQGPCRQDLLPTTTAHTPQTCHCSMRAAWHSSISLPVSVTRTAAVPPVRAEPARAAAKFDPLPVSIIHVEKRVQMFIWSCSDGAYSRRSLTPGRIKKGSPIAQPSLQAQTSTPSPKM